MKLQSIVHFIYNETNTLFNEAEKYDCLYRSIEGYLIRQSRKRNGYFTQVDQKRGWYRVHGSAGKQERIKFYA